MAFLFVETTITHAAVAEGRAEDGQAEADVLSPGAPEELAFYIRHYRIKGVRKLPSIEVEKAVYPFMGPGCRSGHVEQARAALEKRYRDAGYGLVTVAVPPQEVSNGIVTMEVTEGTVRRLRVRGARFFSPEEIRSKAPSLAEGEVPDFEKVKRDILGLNRHPDRQVMMDITPSEAPGEWDVNLNVKDSLPLHGSLELNNRYSPDTTELRLNGGLSYTHLWQAEHTAGFNFQLAPENLDDAAIYSAYYSVPIAERTSLLLSGTKQDSNVNTLGGAAVAGRGHILGARLNTVLPEGSNYYHSLSLGIDYKKFDEDVAFAGQTRSTPIEYYPISLSYGGTKISGRGVAREHSTDVNATLTFHPRGIGSDRYEFDSKRFEATGSFFQLRGDLSHTHGLPGGFQLFGKVQGQWSDYPLINSEQFSGGGLGNARGYLESSVLGDSAFFGSLELRSPSFLGRRKHVPASEVEAGGEAVDTEADAGNQGRVYAFVDGGVLGLNDPLPDQDDDFSMLSVGVGSRFSLGGSGHASLDAGLPLQDAGPVSSGDWLVTFRLWYDF